jgi:hypothetical protein
MMIIGKEECKTPTISMQNGACRQSSKLAAEILPRLPFPASSGGALSRVPVTSNDSSNMPGHLAGNLL